MKEVIIVIQIIVSTMLIGLISIQAKGTGFSKSMGAGTSSFTRRGLEKLTFRMTFVSAFLFIILAITLLFI